MFHNPFEDNQIRFIYLHDSDILYTIPYFGTGGHPFAVELIQNSLSRSDPGKNRMTNKDISGMI